MTRLRSVLMSSRPALMAKDRIYGRYHELNRHADGMLSPTVYKALTDRVAAAPPHMDIVEVGAGAGASSIAICWGMEQAGSTGHLVSIEQCEGGSRRRYGDKSANVQRLEGHLERFGVRDRVRLFTEPLSADRTEDVLALVSTERIGALVCDADGRLDRDVRIFWELLADGGLFVADDYVPGRSWKHDLTYELVNHFREVGLTRHEFTRKGTYFARKIPGSSPELLDGDHCRRLVARYAPAGRGPA